MNKYKSFNNAFLIILTVIISFAANAQKLPTVQKISLRAPFNIKIDGKTTEWGDKFQAYNPSTDIFYTMANDDRGLYLVVQSGDPKIIQRLTAGGITLTIQKTMNKNETNGVSITYPVSKSSVSFNLSSPRNAVEDTSTRYLDSVMISYNKKIDNNYKFIKVTGVTGMDTISVYNTDGIKASARFNNKKVFTCEYYIDYKLLNIATDKIPKLAYHLVVNGRKPLATPPGIAAWDANGVPDQQASDALKAGIEKANMANGPTDFWGDYTLAK